MNGGASSVRVAILRKYQSLKRSLDHLREEQLISHAEFLKARAKADELYQMWRADWERSRPAPLPPGRPPAADDRARFTTCKRTICQNPPEPGQAYCSRQCSPYGHYSDPKGSSA